MSLRAEVLLTQNIINKTYERFIPDFISVVCRQSRINKAILRSNSAQTHPNHLTLPCHVSNTKLFNWLHTTTFNTLHLIFIFNCWKQMNALFLKYAVHTHLIQYSTLFRWKECPENMRRWGNNAVQGLKLEEDKFCHKHIMFMFHIFGQSIANGLVGNLSLKKKDCLQFSYKTSAFWPVHSMTPSRDKAGNQSRTKLWSALDISNYTESSKFGF